MNLQEEYQNQQQWRDWSSYLENVPLSNKDNVIDLGCSVGWISNLLSDEVKNVIGVDANEQFIQFCMTNQRENQDFICQDISCIDFEEIGDFSAIWSSFTLSYISEPIDLLSKIYSHMDYGGWISLVDVSCFMSGNMFKDSPHYNKVIEFELNSHRSGKYDFDFGSKMSNMLRQVGFTVVYENRDISDPELNFNGPASAEVLTNWKARLSRLNGVRKFFSESYPDICREIMNCLASEEHCKNNNLIHTVARKNITSAW